MRRELRGLRILITGASRGIGRCLAEQLVPLGARLVLAARSADELDRLAASLRAQSGDVTSVHADVTSAADRQRLLDTAVTKLGGLDVLVNNAGVCSWGHFASSSEDIMRTVLEVNFFAPAELSRLAIPHLTNGRQPALVNLGSICGRRGLPGFTEHSASKHAICGLTEALRAEMVRFDISVLLVIPGLVRTDDWGRHMLRAEGRYPLDLSNATKPEDVAAAIVHALKTNRSETVVGWKANWLIRVQRLLPRLVDYLLGRRIKQLYSTPEAPANAPRISRPARIESESDIRQ